MNTLIDEWAKLDPDAVLSFLETAELPELELGPMSFRALAASSPERLLTLAEGIASGTKTSAQQAALWALTALDPQTAYNRLATLPTTGDMNRIIGSIAERYAEQDPAGAITWASTLEPHSEVALNRVLSQVAISDPVRVADVIIAEILDPAAANRGDMPSLSALLAEPMLAGSSQLAQVADSLAAYSDPRIRLQLNQMLTSWPQADPDGAVDWVLRNTSVLTRESASSFARQVGSQDPALVRQVLQQIPQYLLGAWLAGAADGMAGNNLETTLSWLEQYRGEESFENARVNALRSGVRNNPATVARLIEDDRELRAELMPQVASAWVSADRAAAEQWILDQPPGVEQDQGIQILLRSSANQGSFDAGLLGRLSSAEAREQAVLSSVATLGRTNPELGRQLIQEHIREPEARRRAEERLEAGGNPPVGSFFLQ